MVDQNKTEEKIDYKYIAIVVSISVVVGLTLIFTLGTYSWKEMKKSIALAKERQQVLTDSQERLEHLKTLADTKDQLEKENKTVLVAIPQDKDISTLFTQLEQIAKQSGMDITSVSETPGTTAAAPSGGLKEHTYAANGKVANYASLKQALSKFETSLRILSITNLNVDGVNGTNLNVKFDIKTYSRG
jgi:Tfp pilus assembly protein PilO